MTTPIPFKYIYISSDGMVFSYVTFSTDSRISEIKRVADLSKNGGPREVIQFSIIGNDRYYGFERNSPFYNLDIIRNLVTDRGNQNLINSMIKSIKKYINSLDVSPYK